MPESPSSSPSAATVVVLVVAAAVIGFLGGALLALTRSGESAPTDVAAPSPAATATATPEPTAQPTATTSADAEITLTADRDSADTEELIRLEGVLRPGSEGVPMQVQQSVDGIGFVDFPVTASTRSDGSFAVWVRTGRVGTNEFRMVTAVQGQQVVSNAVTVQVG